MTRARLSTLVTLVVGAFALTACVQSGVRTSPPPETRPPPVVTPVVVKEPSQSSRALSDYYSRIQQNYLVQGLLRVDGGGPDTPFSRRQLVDNFIKIALFEEFSDVNGRLVRQEAETRLHRWKTPIRMKVEFGDSVSLEKRDRDLKAIVAYNNRLSQLTGLNITLTSDAPNYHVFIVNEDERMQIGPKLRAISPDVNLAAVSTVEGMRRSTLCLVIAIDSVEDGVYSKAFSVIRAEHPDLLRLSCIHEELAQGLGLPNDSPAARPSIFNDDEEFGLLTTHDEFLLRMLYDTRLRSGMTAAQARPIAETIALELLGGDS